MTRLPWALTLGMTLAAALPGRAQDAVDADRLRDAKARGLAWLAGQQQADGSFALPPTKADNLEAGFPMGTTALATLTLLKGGTAPDDPRIERAFRHLYGLPLRRTYSVALLVLCIEARFAPPPPAAGEQSEQSYTRVARKAFGKLGRPVDRAKLTECVNWLLSKQSSRVGVGWRYPSTAAIDQDNSCTQYAVLALKGARRLGAEVPLDVFARVADFFVAQQDATGPEVPWFSVPAADGPIGELLTVGQRRKLERKERKRDEKAQTRARKRGEATEERAPMHARGWSYEPREVGDPPASRRGPVPDRAEPTQRSTGSMTCSGVAALAICKSELELAAAAWRPREEAVEQALRDGCAWLATYFDPRANPCSGPTPTVGWKYYYLYSVERAGVLAGTYRFGGHDWWEEGAAHLLALQEPEGTWPDAPGVSRLSRTCFALLFLTRGTVPLLPLPPKRVMTGGGGRR